MNTGYVLKLIRTSKGMSQKEMADFLGISQNYLSLIESNKKSPSPEKIADFAKTLNVSEYALIFASSGVPEELSAEDKKQFRKLQQNILTLLLFELKGRVVQFA
jgi:transcriptional regulator with XRE-family HTH domain